MVRRTDKEYSDQIKKLLDKDGSMTLYSRDELMKALSSRSSKLLTRIIRKTPNIHSIVLNEKVLAYLSDKLGRDPSIESSWTSYYFYSEQTGKSIDILCNLLEQYFMENMTEEERNLEVEQGISWINQQFGRKIISEEEN